MKVEAKENYDYGDGGVNLKIWLSPQDIDYSVDGVLKGDGVMSKSGHNFILTLFHELTKGIPVT